MPFLLLKNTQATLKDIRLNADKEFTEFFKSVEKNCGTLEIDVCVPRISGRQTHRNNVDVDTPESYYRAGPVLPNMYRGVELKICRPQKAKNGVFFKNFHPTPK